MRNQFIERASYASPSRFGSYEYVGKSRRDAMFIEKVPTTDPTSPFMGERLFGCAPKWSFTDFNSGSCSINISPLRGFSDRLWLRSYTQTHGALFSFPASCLLLTASCLLPSPFSG